MIILKREAIEFINKRLLLPFSGFEQDWDIEMADPARVSEFVEFYQKGSESASLSEEEKKALMALIIASYNDLLDSQSISDSTLWSQISALILRESDIFGPIISYWSLENDKTTEDHFKVTPLLRQLVRYPEFGTQDAPH